MVVILIMGNRRDIDIKRKSLPHIETYYKRILNRSAYREHVAISYDELRAAK